MEPNKPVHRVYKPNPLGPYKDQIRVQNGTSHHRPHQQNQTSHHQGPTSAPQHHIRRVYPDGHTSSPHEAHTYIPSHPQPTHSYPAQPTTHYTSAPVRHPLSSYIPPKVASPLDHGYKPSQSPVYSGPPRADKGGSSGFTEIIKILNGKIDDSIVGKNAFWSPMSIALALAMVYEGTDKGLKSDFERVLGFDSSKEARGRSMLIMDSLLKPGTPDKYGPKNPFQLTVGNSLWHADRSQLQPEFVSWVQKLFKASCEPLDTRNPQGSCDKVNGWISDKTAGMIKNMLTPESFGPDLILI